MAKDKDKNEIRLDKMSEEEQFNGRLDAFYESAGIKKLRQKPTIAKQPVNLLTLYKHVTDLGGFDAVSQIRGGWRQAAIAACGTSLEPNTATSNRCKEQYVKRLLDFEKQMGPLTISNPTLNAQNVESDEIKDENDDIRSENTISEPPEKVRKTVDHDYDIAVTDDETDVNDAHEIILAAINEMPDLDVLNERRWLSDGVIYEYLKYIVQRGGQQRNVFAFDIFFYDRLRRHGPDAQLLRWTGRRGRARVDLFAIDFVFVPINLDNRHWTLSVVNVQRKTISYYDSAGGGKVNMGCCPASYGTPEDHMKRILAYLSKEHQDKKDEPLPEGWKINPVGQSEDVLIPQGRIPQQQNGYDCGVFVCKYADCISRGEPLTFTQSDITNNYYRREIKDVILALHQLPGSDDASRPATSDPMTAEQSVGVKIETADPSSKSDKRKTGTRPGQIPLKSDNIKVPTRKDLFDNLITEGFSLAEFMSAADEIDRKCAVRYWVRTRNFTIPVDARKDEHSYSSLLYSRSDLAAGILPESTRAKLVFLREIRLEKESLEREAMKLNAAIKRKTSVQVDVSSDEKALLHVINDLIFVKCAISEISKLDY